MERINSKLLLRATSKNVRNCIIFFSEGLLHILTGSMVLKYGPKARSIKHYLKIGQKYKFLSLTPKLLNQKLEWGQAICLQQAPQVILMCAKV